MCVIVAKYFPGIGWAGAKNRDRNYVPTLDFEVLEDGDLQQIVMHDQVTGYKEGINSNGVSILNTSLDVYDDESEVESGEASTSPDGVHIQQALKERDPLRAVKSLINSKLGGCTMVFNRDQCFLIEASDDDGHGPYKYKFKEIPKDHLLARTNHGLWLKWAGYQRVPGDRSETQSRISSDARLLQAQSIVRRAKKPQDLVDGMCQVYVDDPQLNVMRTSTGTKKMRTTSQQLCVPAERTLYCRPVSSNLQFDFWKLNKPDRDVWVEVLSNRELWQHQHNHVPFGNMHLKDVK